MRRFWQDIRHSARTLRKRPAFAVLAIAMLALGVGVNTTMFSVVNSVLLRGLPYENSDRIVGLFFADPKSNVHLAPVSAEEAREWSEEAKNFEAIAATRVFSASMRTDRVPERISGIRVSPSLLSVFRLAPVLGRAFKPDDATPGQEQVALISWSLWRNRFAAAPDVVGRPLVLDDRSYIIIGVLPERTLPPELTNPPSVPDVWIPFVASKPEQNRGLQFLRLFGRLKPGVKLEAAAAEMNVLNARNEQAHPEAHKGWLVETIPLKQVLVGQVRPVVLVLVGAVACVLLITCVNIATLVLARTITRSTEIAVRSALGATPGRIVRQLLTESLCLSSLAGLLGLGLAAGAVRLLRAGAVPLVPRTSEVHVDLPALLFALATTTFAGMLFGAAPAQWAARASLVGSLRQRSAASLSRSSHRFLRALATAQIALALVLAVSAGLMVRSFQRLRSVPPGFDPTNVTAAQVDLAVTRYAGPEQHARFYHSAIRKLRDAAGIDAAAVISRAPMIGGLQNTSYQTQDHPLPPNDWPSADTRLVSPGYFDTMGIALLRGRDFAETDTQDSPHVIVVNREAAARLWPDQEAVGKQMQIWPEKSMRTVIAVVGDVKLSSLEADTTPTLYIPLQQNPFFGAARSAVVVVRSRMGPALLAATVKRELANVDDGQAIGKLQRMTDVVEASLALRRFAAFLTAAFAALAVVLATMGVYAMMSFMVSARTREFGIKAALGARRGQILGSILRQGTTLAAGGVVLGSVAVLAANPLLKAALFGLGAADSMTLSLNALLVVAIAVLASYVPALRASAVSPTVAIEEN